MAKPTAKTEAGRPRTTRVDRETKPAPDGRVLYEAAGCGGDCRIEITTNSRHSGSVTIRHAVTTDVRQSFPAEDMTRQQIVDRLREDHRLAAEPASRRAVVVCSCSGCRAAQVILEALDDADRSSWSDEIAEAYAQASKILEEGCRHAQPAP